jgi:hypothetical protein
MEKETKLEFTEEEKQLIKNYSSMISSTLENCSFFQKKSFETKKKIKKEHKFFSPSYKFY